jgi:hypothetical protein
MDRPTLLPHLRPLWRDRTTLQLGTDPDRAVVVEFGQPAAARILPLLDGTRTERAVHLDAGRLGIAGDQVAPVLDALYSAGVLVAAQTLVPSGLPPADRRRLAGEAAALATRAGTSPAQVLRRRACAQVLVAGQARLVAPIAVALATAGVGHVASRVPGPVCTTEDLAVGGLTAGDVGRPSADAIAAAVTRSAPGAVTRTLRPEQASFLVRVGFDSAPPALTARTYARRRLPHLVVAVRDAAVVVGPFVPPAGSPCLACLDLHRTDRDPAWRRLAPQLAGDSASIRACATATLLIGVGHAVGEVLSFLDGGTPKTLGGCLEIDTNGTARRRSWQSHPRCDCRLGRRSRRHTSELI